MINALIRANGHHWFWKWLVACSIPCHSCHYKNWYWLISTNPRQTIFNSLWPSDTIRWQGTESTLAQVMACCLMAPSHYLNQCWLIMKGSATITRGQFTRDNLAINYWSTEISLKISYLNFYSNLPGANKLTHIMARTKQTSFCSYCRGLALIPSESKCCVVYTVQG